MEYGTEVMDKLKGQPALRALGAVLGDLAEIGYDAKWTGVRASDAGAAHQRFRVFVVAYPASE
jgi:DNA (cytosine-5)-methyltransferase 1